MRPRPLAKSIFDAGRLTQKSSIQIKDLLPHPTTSLEAKIQLINLCEQLTGFCVVVDQWTEAYTGISYCGIALRYVDQNFQLYTFILSCFPYNAPSHSVQHVREFVNKALQEFKLQLDSTKYVVSDNEPKMISAFRAQCSRIGCADHYLNKQLQHAFESDKIHLNETQIEKVDCEFIQHLFGHVKKVVSFVRRSDQQQKLSRKLQSYSKNRFAGDIIMLNIFREVFFELSETLVNCKTMEDYNLIEKELLDDICNFLGSFQDVIDDLSVDQELTLHRVIPLRQYLINKCDVKEDDSTAIVQLKVFLERRMKSAWLITDEHRLATILHPKLKSSDRFLNEKQKSIDVLKLALEKHQLINSSSYTNSLTSTHVNSKISSPTSTHINLKTSSSTSTTNKTQKRKNLLSQCFDTKVDAAFRTSNPYQEIDDYLNSDLSQCYYEGDNSDDIDVLLFWKDKQHSFPILSLIAKEIFAIPASNTVIERLFSASQNVVTEKRTRLGCEKINQLLFLQKNFNTLKQLADINNKKRIISMSSTTTVSSEESACTIPKQMRLDVEDDFDYFDDTEIFLD